MEHLDAGRDHTSYELPFEREGDPDVVLMSTGKLILRKDMDAYKESFAAEREEDDTKRSFETAVAIGAAGTMAFAIFAAVRNRRSDK